MTGTKLQAEVAGAGIGGLATAIGLAQRGWQVTVHERADTLRTFGAGIYIWSNGLRVLKALGAYDQATAGAHIGPQFHTRDQNNTTMEEIPINGPNGARLITILRETLIQSLVAAAHHHGVTILTNSAAVGAQADGRLILADGSTRLADLVVGADGINSRVRDSLDLMMYRKHLGYGAVRMLIARDDGDVPDEDRNRYIEYFSGTRRILYTPASSKDLYVALCCAADDAGALSVPADRALWTGSFPFLARLIARFGDAGRWDAFEVVKLKRWSAGRVAILGDAAHAMPPYLGQGGGCALMNGLALAAAVSGDADVEAGLSAWEMRERPLTEHTQDTAEQLGLMNFWPDDVRSQVLKITGQCREIGAERMKTALHVPTASEEFVLSRQTKTNRSCRTDSIQEFLSMQSVKLGANTFSYDEAGDGPALLLLSGWCQDHRLFKTLAPELAKTHRVIRLDWRGHGDDRTHDGDFDTDDQASDVIDFLDFMKIESVVPVSTSHGGWANIEFTDRSNTSRVPRSIVIDWIMTAPNESFFTMIDDIQDRTNWENGRADFFNYWIGDTKNRDIINHVNNEMAGFSYEMWARSGREIALAYRKWGSPMQRMTAMKESRPITHIYSQPFEPEYAQAQLDFASTHRWFKPSKLQGTTHFPTLEQPEVVAAAIRAFAD